MTMSTERPCTNPDCEDGYVVDCGDENTCPTCYGDGMETVHEGGSCDVCGRSSTWGCGHDAQMEADARAHMASPEHRNGTCWHFDHDDCDPDECSRAGIKVPGYAAFVKHAEAPEFFAKLDAKEKA